MVRRAVLPLLLASSFAATAARAQQGGGATATVHVEANEPGVHVVAETGRGAEWERTRFYRGRIYTFVGQPRHFRSICEAPCAVELPAGEYSMALARGGALVPVEDPVVVPGPATLRATYESRHGLRVAGHLTLAIGVPIGLAAFILGVTQTVSPDEPFTIAGGAVLVTSIVVGSILSLQHDKATIEVVPSSPVSLLEHSIFAATPLATETGLALRVRF